MSQSIISKGIAKFSEGMLDEAETLFCRAIEAEPSNAEAWFLRGKTRRQKGDLTGANNDFYKALDLDPNHQQARVGVEMLQQIFAFRNTDLYNV